MVPEDRSDGGDRQLPIRVVVFPATGPDRQSDPVVWFAGGPGDSAVDTISRVRPLLAPATPAGTWSSSNSAAPGRRP